MLGDRRVDHPLRAELVQQALADLVGALVLRDLLADQEHVVVAAQFRRHRVAQRLAHGDRLGRAPVLLRLRARRRSGARQPALRRRRLRPRRRLRRGAGAASRRPPAPRLASSPFAASTAIGVFTATPSVPSSTRICASLPSSTASTSIVALSVSISAITSPACTSSPTCFSQRDELALGHRGRQRRHQDLRRHRSALHQHVGPEFGLVRLRTALREIGGVLHDAPSPRRRSA